jgi:altronate dehydratase small subunit
MQKDALVIRRQDNVATAIRDIPAGRAAQVGIEDESVSVTVSKDISFGHKFALHHIRRGEEILKYGTVIGRATQDIQPGEHVHVHNVESTRGRGDLA